MENEIMAPKSGTITQVAVQVIINVAVNTNSIPVTGVTLDKSELILTEGDTSSLIATVAPANASNQNVTWSTSDASVATVDATGKVTAVGNGTAIITATTVDGSKTATATITVNISTGGNIGENDSNGENNDNGNGNGGNDSNNSNASNDQSGSDNNQIVLTPPKAGDENNLLLWVILLIGFSATVSGMIIMNMRRADKQ